MPNVVPEHASQFDVAAEGIKDAPYDLVQAEFEAVAALGAYAEVGEDEEACVFVVVHGVFKVVQG